MKLKIWESLLRNPTAIFIENETTPDYFWSTLSISLNRSKKNYGMINDDMRWRYDTTDNTLLKEFVPNILLDVDWTTITNKKDTVVIIHYCVQENPTKNPELRVGLLSNSTFAITSVMIAGEIMLANRKFT